MRKLFDFFRKHVGQLLTRIVLKLIHGPCRLLMKSLRNLFFHLLFLLFLDCLRIRFHFIFLVLIFWILLGAHRTDWPFHSLRIPPRFILKFLLASTGFCSKRLVRPHWLDTLPSLLARVPWFVDSFVLTFRSRLILIRISLHFFLNILSYIS